MRYDNVHYEHQDGTDPTSGYWEARAARETYELRVTVVICITLVLLALWGAIAIANSPVPKSVPIPATAGQEVTP